jgi:hypothetical protein
MANIHVGDLVKYTENGCSWMGPLDQPQSQGIVEFEQNPANRMRMVGVIVGKSWHTPSANGDGVEIYKVEVAWLCNGVMNNRRAEYLDDLEIVSRGRQNEKG